MTIRNHTLALFGGQKVRTKPFPSHPVLGKEEKQHVRDVLRTGVLSGFLAGPGDAFYGGPKVRALENEFKQYFGVRYAVAVNSATAGLHTALAAAGIGPGDEVIVTPYTMSASASAVLMCQALPVFADITEDTFCLDAAAIEKKVTPRTRAIVVVHLFGQAADMVQIMKIARRHKLAVIEDCAQAPGATYRNQFVGTMGTAGVFSLNQHKTITTGEGGIIITNNRFLAKKAQLIRNHGEAVVAKMRIKDIVNTLGWNYRMTELEAAVGLGQFGRLDFLTGYRIELANYLRALLARAGLPGLTLPVVRPGNTHVYFSFSIRFDEKKAGLSRAAFARAVRAEGVPLAEGYVRPLYLEPLYQKQICFGKSGYPFRSPVYNGRPDYRPGLCPVAERMHFKELLTTGLCRYPVRKRDIRDVAAAMSKVFDNRKQLVARQR